MKKVFVSLLVLLAGCFTTTLTAQISQGGTPLSFKPDDKISLSEIPFKVMSSVDVEALKKEDVYNDQIKDIPWRFGENIMVNLNPKNSGTWDVLKDGSKLWRLGITSKGALTINLTFDNYKLPKGATLFIYNTDKTEVIGAFTDFNNQEDRYFATTLIRGESVIIEYYEPAHAEFSGELNLWRVTHGYRGVSDFEKSFGESGACNVNAVCSQGDPIRDQIRSVAMLVIGGSGFCTGALINNTNNDGTPYLLSANHCYTTPGTVVFWFNWQSATCSNPGTSPAHNSVSGATDKAKYATSDFWLMQLNTAPPAEYNIFYSGWNHTTDANIATKVWGIHHPSGDIKKISWEDDGVTTSAYLGATGSGTDHWRIDSWSDGTTTEPGSSGSPLFDTQGRIIGQLHGGWAACGNTDPDYYGKLGISWTGGGTNATRLSNWLDPAATGAVTLDGYDPNTPTFAVDGAMNEIVIPTVTYTDTIHIIPTVIISNEGTDALTDATITYIIDGTNEVTYNWTGSLNTNEMDSIKFPEIKLEYGDHVFVSKITVVDDENPENDSLVINYTVDPFVPPVSLNARLQDEDDVYLSWNPKAGGSFTDGFESGDFSNWGDVVEGPGTIGDVGFPYWYVQNSEPNYIFEGSYSAVVNWGYNLDTWIITPEVDASVNTVVTFEWQSSYYWSVDPNDNADMFVKVSTDGGTSWDNLWTFGEIGVWDNFTWYETTLDLSAYSGSAIQVAFNVVANDNGDVALDNVYVGEGFKKTGTRALSSPAKVKQNVKSVRGLNLKNDRIVQPDKISLVDYSIFRDGVEIAQTADSSYIDTSLAAGNYTYYVIANYTDPEGSSSPSNEVEIVVPNALSAPYLTGFVDGKDVNLAWSRYIASDYQDSFETGDFSNWGIFIEGPGTIGENIYPYWFVQSDYPDYVLDGSYSALVSWGYTIDTWITSPPLNVNENSMLEFYWQSSYYWNVDPNDNGDLFVKLSTDGGISWETIWTFGEIGLWDNWAWYVTTIDLSYYSGGTIILAFNVVASDNSDITLDSVSFKSSDKLHAVGTHRISPPLVTNEDARSIRNVPGDNFISPLNKAATFVDYSVYRDDEEINSTNYESFTDPDLPPGTYLYYVVANYTDTVGTADTSNTFIAVVNVVSTENHPAQESALIYPNPSHGSFTIETDGKYSVTVLDMSGIMIVEFDISSTAHTLDLSKVGAGIYFLKFRSDDTSFTAKVIVK
jgi:lysyl endopeptidase